MARNYVDVRHGIAALTLIRYLMQEAHDKDGQNLSVDYPAILAYLIDILDQYLTGNRDLHQTRQQAMQEYLAGASGIFYLSDGGYSRLVLNWVGVWYRLDGPPSQGVQERWKLLEV